MSNIRAKVQWNLLTILLLTAAVATWTSFLRILSETERLKAENRMLVSIAAELLIRDPEQYALIKVPPVWFDDHRWDLWLPQGNEYWLNFASRGIDPQGSLRRYPDPTKRIRIGAGRHRIELRTRKKPDAAWQLELTCDDNNKLMIDETADWKPVVGTSTYTDGNPHQSSQHSIDRPLLILRRVHHIADGEGGSAAPDSLASGVVLWVSRKTSSETDGRSENSQKPMD